MKKLLCLLPILAIMASCSHKTSDNVKSETSDPGFVRAAPLIMSMGGQQRQNYIPKATAFKTNGDYADNVAITLSPEGELTYFPAPTDLSENSIPLPLGDGWYLNRQGLGPGSVFTTFTFKEYMALKEVPSPQELIKAIIPGSKVTEFVRLPFNINQVPEDLNEIKNYLNGK